eukprot:TRINITY_DN8125_c1_g1_i1.p1 TRINITY_DN8125_c1_g1~~TRINITY_DN8125_c1_g1_i1.p1  ORF type:complete len:965 (+),score=342.99 TRINITY_DN8125_c1_g1_i1:88-2982(+)
MAIVISQALRRRLESQPPAGYIAGLGRGATGFTTRSDIGPATAGPGAEEPAGPPAAEEEKDAEPEDKGDYSDAKFDEWGGFSENLFRGVQWDGDDDDADKVYRAVDQHMDGRRKRRREEQEEKALEEYRKAKPKIATQFADLKKALAGVSEEEWKEIPDIGDYSVKKKKQDIWTPVPDSLLLGGMDGGMSSSLDPRQMRYHHGGMDTPAGVTPITPMHGGMTPLPGGMTPLGGATPVTDLRSLGEARNAALSVQLKQVSDSVTGQTVVDPKGYMTALRSMRINSESEVSDIKRARVLLKWVTQTNPAHGPGWIAWARVEQLAGRLAHARRIIAEGCENAPQSEEVWVEAVRMATPQSARVVIAKAVDKLPTSVKLWTEAARLETEPKRKKAVLRKALELVPNSVRLWKEAVELEQPEDAKTLLGRAVECVNSVDLWLALARLETYDKAKKVLNAAREANPTEAIIWITAAELEEAAGNKEGMERIIRKAVKTLCPQHCSREQWLREAEKAERADHHLTCQAIVWSAVGVEVAGDDRARKHVWIDDAQKCIDNKAYKTARAIYAYALAQFPDKAGLWIKAADLEKAHGSADELDSLLRKAVHHCPNAEYLWLMAAKEKWLGGDVQAARTILAEAFSHNQESEQIWVAAVKLEAENGQLERAGQVLAKARDKCPNAPRIWLKSAKLERQLGRRQQERDLLGEALAKWPGDQRLWLMLLQWEQWRCQRTLAAATPGAAEQERANLRALYTQAVKSCPDSVPVWRAASGAEETVLKDVVKARSVLEKARIKLPKTPELWLSSVRLEARQGRHGMAQQLLSKGLQECPDSGMLWTEAIEMEPGPSRRAKAVAALKKCERDASVICAVARIFWAERKIDMTRKWFTRAVALDKDFGDAWAFFFRFEAQHGTDEQRASVLKRCVAAEPHHGERWIAVTKDLKNATVGGCRLSTEEILREVAGRLEVDEVSK